MTQDEFYFATNQALTLILDNLDKIVVISQSVLITICGICIYHLFWGMRK